MNKQTDFDRIKRQLQERGTVFTVETTPTTKTIRIAGEKRGVVFDGSGRLTHNVPKKA